MRYFKKTLYKLYKLFVGIYIHPVFFIGKFLVKNGKLEAMREILIEICKLYEEFGDEFASFKLRPKTSNLIEPFYRSSSTYPKYAIIIQGPLLMANNFTLETIRLYLKIFPEANIILSTWEDEPSDYIAKFNNLGIHVILNSKPLYTGVMNCNLQIVSSKNGVKKARELGAEYVLKTRSDQRIYKDNIIGYFNGLLKQFPPEGNLKKRKIIVVDGNTGGTMFMPYCIKDFLYYGHIDEIEMLFNIELDKRNMSSKEIGDIRKKNNNSRVDIAKMSLVPEIYITKQYLKNITGFEQKDNSILNWWSMLKCYFICISGSEIELYWYKYQYRYIEKFSREKFYYDKYWDSFNYNFDFVYWLSLYSGFFECSDYMEKIANTKYSDEPDV